MEHLINQLEELREEAKQQFGNQFTDSFHAQIYKDWTSVLHHLDMHATTKLILMRMIELKWHCQTTFTVSSMAKDLNMVNKTVNLNLKKLEEIGLCYKHSETTNQWTINLKKLF